MSENRRGGGFDSHCMWLMYGLQTCVVRTHDPKQSDAYREYHRLRGSASPVSTTTHHSYGSPRLSDFFPNSPTLLEARPQPIFTQNGSNDVDSHKDVPFAVKSLFFMPPDLQAPQKVKISQIFRLRKIFLSISPLTLEVTERTPLFFIGAKWKWHSE